MGKRRRGRKRAAAAAAGCSAPTARLPSQLGCIQPWPPERSLMSRSDGCSPCGAVVQGRGCGAAQPAPLGRNEGRQAPRRPGRRGRVPHDGPHPGGARRQRARPRNGRLGAKVRRDNLPRSVRVGDANALPLDGGARRHQVRALPRRVFRRSRGAL